MSRRQLGRLIKLGLVRPVLRGVYAAAQAPNDPQLRAEALSLVLPDAAVVVDRTAAWLHGVDILPRSAVHQVPPLDIAHVTDTRMRRPETAGQRRGLLPTDVTVISGIPVTTALRTAVDLGRTLWKYEALAAIDGFLRAAYPMTCWRRRWTGSSDTAASASSARWCRWATAARSRRVSQR